MENAMNCSSLPDNQTADFIERFFPFTYNQILENDSGCYDFVNHEYVIWHRSLAEALPLSVQQYGYDSIPNLLYHIRYIQPGQRRNFPDRRTAIPGKQGARDADWDCGYGDRLYKSLVTRSGWKHAHRRHLGSDGFGRGA